MYVITVLPDILPHTPPVTWLPISVTLPQAWVCPHPHSVYIPVCAGVLCTAEAHCQYYHYTLHTKHHHYAQEYDGGVH